MADAKGLKYVEVRFWRHLDYYTYAPYVSDATFQNDITTAVNKLNSDYAANNIPLRFYASCNIYTFRTNQYNTSTRQISKSDASSFINGKPAMSKGLDVFYFDGQIMGDNGGVNFARLPQDGGRTYFVAATGNGLRNATITHEVGHAFGLRHTHDNARGSGTNNRTASGCYQESVSRVKKNYWYNGCTSQDNRLKCEVNGDQIADTHASIEELASYIPGGVYNNGAGTDNWGDSWTPPVRNYMSYVNTSYMTEFTPMQVAIMLHYADTRTVVPAASIAGPARLCQGQTGSFTVSAAGATGFSWNVPTGFSILSGQGSSTISVRNNSSFSGGVVDVTLGGCGAFGASKNVSGNLGYFYVIGNQYIYPGSMGWYSASNYYEPGISFSWSLPPDTYAFGGTTNGDIALNFSPNFNGGI